MASNPHVPAINSPVAGQEMSVIVTLQQVIQRIDAVTRAIVELQEAVATLQAQL